MLETPPTQKLLAGGLVRLKARLLGTRRSGFVLIALLLVLWECSARLNWVVSDNWPPVSKIADALFIGLLNGELIAPLLGTLRRMAVGLVAGSTAALVLGIIAGTIRPVRYVVLPLVEALRPIPAPAIIPPLILFLGIDDALKVMIIALASFFPVFLNTLAGISNIDDVLVQTARTFRIGWWRTATQVVLPAALPAIAAGMRTAIGLSLVVAVTAEMIAGSGGVGYYIVQMQYALKPHFMYASIVCLAVAGYAINFAFVHLERRALPWVGRS